MPKISFRCSPELADKLDKLAAEKSSTRSLVICDMLERGKTSTTNKKDLLHLLGHVSKIGNNLNQIARQCNTGKAIDIAMLSTLTNIEKELRQLVEQVK